MKWAATTVAAYLKELPAERRVPLTKLRTLIRKIAPQARETMQYGMASYTLGDLLFALASQKNYIALYICESDAVETHRSALGKLNCGKACIRFRKLEELPLDVIENILRDAVRHRNASQTQSKGSLIPSRAREKNETHG